MKPDTWMPLYPGDYLRDTMHLSRSEHGSYILLIMAYWSSGEPLPDDDATLRTIARCPDAEWSRTRGLLSKFFQVEGGVWRHKRIEEELATAHKLSNSYSRRGKMGAETRWEKGQEMAEPIAQPIAEPSPSQCLNDAKPMPNEWLRGVPSPSPSPSPSESPSQSHSKGVAIAPTRPSLEAEKAIQKRFVKPTMAEVELQAAKIGLPKSECIHFMNYYESNGWRVGKNPMKSWSHALSNWKLQGQRYAPTQRDGRPIQTKSIAEQELELMARREGVIP